MNVILQTNCDGQRLELIGVEKSGQDYSCWLAVESRGFCARRTFYFDESNLQTFLGGLAEMNAKLIGEAVLKHQFEDDFISLKLSGSGHVIVSGRLVEHGEYEQQLEFSFRSDQTVLGPLIQGMGKLSILGEGET